MSIDDAIGRSIHIPARLVFLMWAVFSVEHFWHVDFGIFGIYPREPFGLIGIFAAPLLHGNIIHLSYNTLPVLFLGTAVYFFYRSIGNKVFYHCYFITGSLVWIFGRSSIHIGASGLIYGLASFLIFYGFFKKDFKSLIISAVVIFFYGSLIYGIMPNQPGVSWESHLLGGIVGFGSARYYGSRG